MNVFEQNEAYNLGEYHLNDGCAVAALRWSVASLNHTESKISVLKHVFHLIEKNTHSLKLWSIVGDSVWQSDTRIIRHKKLFKRLKSRGAEIDHASMVIEDCLENNGLIRFFGAVEISEASIESVIKVMNEETCSFLIAVPESFDVRPVISCGWNARDEIDPNLLAMIVRNQGLIIKSIGAFDDPEAGFVAFGSPSRIKELNAK